MRNRVQDANGDYVFGRGPSQFMVDSADAVAQAARTRLELFTGDWFLDAAEGTPYATDILGNNTAYRFDAAMTARILDTPGVAAITDYASTLDSATRQLRIVATIATVYGSADVTATIDRSVTPVVPYVDDDYVN